MIKVTELRDLIPAKAMAALDKKQIQNVVADIAESARNHWMKLAEKDQSHLRFDYILGIQAVQYTGGQAVLSLIGEIPHMLEDGAPAIDMRTTLLGPNVPVVAMGERGKHKNASGGFYRAIPIRHKTPKSTKIKETGSAARRAHRMGKDIYKIAKGLKSHGRLQAGLAPKLAKHHRTDIYAGMKRIVKQYSKGGPKQSQYVTFRTISTTVHEGWVRKRYVARNYAKQVNSFVKRLAPKAIAAFIKGASGK